VNSLKLCTTAGACGGVIINPAKIGYLGISLGGIVGSVLTAMTPDIKAAVLNVPGVGLVDILENTDSAAIRCSLVDGLIGAGIVEGAKSNPPTYTTGACTTPAWKTQPGYLSFANSARWILDSADGANFNTRLAPRRFLIQKVTGDQVVPNATTDTLAALVGFTAPAPADTLSPVPSPMPPSAAISTTPQQNKWLQYTSTTDYAFGHGSLLAPAAASAAGVAGTTRVQTDAITYLLQNVSL
jgi:pimeloyl-ACP methyl ester carboxylesterase